MIKNKMLLALENMKKNKMLVLLIALALIFASIEYSVKVTLTLFLLILTSIVIANNLYNAYSLLKLRKDKNVKEDKSLESLNKKKWIFILLSTPIFLVGGFYYFEGVILRIFFFFIGLMLFYLIFSSRSVNNIKV